MPNSCAGSLTGARAMLGVAVLAFALVAGCSGAEKRPATVDSASASASSAAPSESTNPAAAKLAALAKKSAQLRYSSRYREKPATGTGSATVSFARNARGFRFTVRRGSATSSLIVNGAGGFQCRQASGPAGCAQVSKPGKAVPRRFDPQLQHAFTNWQRLLSTPREYSVRSTTLPGVRGTCFAVAAGAAPPAGERVGAGTYCYSADGAITGVKYTTGTLVLTTRTAAPTRLPLPAKPSPLPSS